jgi:hypothetical protein
VRPGSSPWPARLVGLALALAIALGFSSFHVVPTPESVIRAISDPPSWLRCWLAGVAGLGGAAWLGRFPTRVHAPFLALAIAAAPLVPLFTGRFLLLLAFQGPLLVLVGSMAAAVAFVRWREARTLPRIPDAALFAAGFLLYAGLGIWVPGATGPQGDEPHYLVMAESLLHDGDLDLADEFAARAYAPFFSGTLEAHTSPASPRGRIYSVHTPGLPVLILPAYALGGYPAARLLMSALAACAGLLVARLVRESTGSPALSLASWAILTLTPPLAFYAVAIYPETPACLATALFLLFARRDPTPRRLLAAGAVAAALPWLHPKFLPLAILGLGLVLVRRGPGWARLAALGSCAASLVGLLLFFEVHYGHASLGAAYGPGLGSDLSLRRIPEGLLGLLLDRQFGLLSVSPVWCLALPGLSLLIRDRFADGMRVLLLGGASALTGAAFSMWWGGACPPARFLVPALPALALAMAWALRRYREPAAALTGLGIGIVILASLAPRVLLNRADGQSALLHFLAPALDLGASLPSLVLPGLGGRLLALTILAGLAWGFLRGQRAFVGAFVACAALSSGLRETPLLDPRGAPLQLLAEDDGENIVGLSGPVDLTTLRIPLDLPAAPWRIAPGDERLSRRLDLPAGSYRLHVEGSVLAAVPTAHVVRLDLISGETLLSRSYVIQGQPAPTVELPLGSGARRVQLDATGVQGIGSVAAAWLQPVSVVPRRERDSP